MDVVFLLFDKVTVLDAVGPYEVLHRVPGANVKFVAQEPGPKSDERGGLKLVADHSFDEEESADVLVVPGGLGTRPLIKDDATLQWIRAIDDATQWTTSVCTGALLLAAAGLLNHRPAATHWLSYELLRSLGAEPTEQRVVFSDKYVTAAGVSSGIDMALALVQHTHGDELAQTIQLAIEYDPQPPVDAGSPSKAPAEIVERLRERARARD